MLSVEQPSAQTRRKPQGKVCDGRERDRREPSGKGDPSENVHHDLPSPVVGASQLEHDRALTRDDMRRADAKGRS